MSHVDPKEKSAVSEEAEHWPLNAAKEASQDRGQSWPPWPALNLIPGGQLLVGLERLHVAIVLLDHVHAGAPAGARIGETGLDPATGVSVTVGTDTPTAGSAPAFPKPCGWMTMRATSGLRPSFPWLYRLGVSNISGVTHIYFCFSHLVWIFDCAHG